MSRMCAARAACAGRRDQLQLEVERFLALGSTRTEPGANNAGDREIRRVAAIGSVRPERSTTQCAAAAHPGCPTKFITNRNPSASDCRPSHESSPAAPDQNPTPGDSSRWRDRKTGP